MRIPFLATKLHIPQPKTNLVLRQRLFDLLDASLEDKFTLISAPAGFGKTTLLSAWVERLGVLNIGYHQAHTLLTQQRTVMHPQKVKKVQVGWVSLDKGDNDPIHFLAYLVRALRRIIPDFGQAILSVLQSSQTPDLETLLTDLINEIAEIKDSFILVLDDYHVINEKQVHDAATFILENLPSQMHLIISSRADPPWSLARLRARHEMSELRAEDLRFTLEEVAAFLNEVMKLDLSAEGATALERRTEGWIAGLQMAALSMRGREDPAGFIQAFTGSHRFILDYLVEEVLDQQPPEVKEFLLKTSILEQMNVSLCDAVSGGTEGKKMLRRLEENNLFLIPLDDERCWYRYHHLFSELLRNQLTLTYPNQIPVLHQRASKWLEEEGFAEEAIAHAFTAKDYQQVARLVEKYAWDMLHQSKYNILSSWIEVMPEELVWKYPWLCIFQSWTRHWVGIREGGEDSLKHVERILNRMSSESEAENRTEEIVLLSEEEQRILPGYIAAVRSHYALISGEIHKVIEHAQVALKVLPEDEYFARATTGVALGGAYWGKGDVSLAEQAFAGCASNALKGGFLYKASPALCYVGMQQVKQAQLWKAEKTFRDALAYSQSPEGHQFPSAGYPLAKLSELACEWNDLEQARRDAANGVRLCTQLGQIDLLAEACSALGHVQLAQQDFVGVKDTLNQTHQLSETAKLDPWITCWLDECRVRLWLKERNLAEVARWVKTCGLGLDDALSYHHDLHHINLARVLVALGKQNESGPYLDDALGLLNRLLGAAENAGWVHEKIKVLVQKALALQALGNIDKALDTLSQALELAESSGYVRTFIGEGAPMKELLEQAAMQGVVPEYLKILLSEFEKETKNQQGQTDEQPPLVDPLTNREMEVLKLLTTNLAVPEIADHLFISSNTVRSHVKRIYDKLEVHRRFDAIQKAKELNLV